MQPKMAVDMSDLRNKNSAFAQIRRYYSTTLVVISEIVQARMGFGLGNLEDMIDTFAGV